VLTPLPIDAAIDDIRRALRESRAVVIVAEPGAGKTTRVPPALVDAGPLILLQPRRAAARAIARRIAEERGWTVGREVGWHVRFERRFARSTGLIVATEGILTARLQQDPLLSAFTTIVIDEFHERSIHADLALAMSWQAVRARDDLRLVVMSATLDAARVSSFLDGCPVVSVPGRLHPIAIEYHPELESADAVAGVVARSTGSVLVFEPGAAEIARTVAAVTARIHPSIDVFPLHGGLDSAAQEQAMAPASRRRVIVATNIAETSLTVPGVTAVVDTGLEKVARYDAERAIDHLALERITQASADQRAGRAGRVAPGIVWRLWDTHSRLRPYREPEIHRIDLAGVLLDVLAWGGDPATFGWFEAPDADAIATGTRLLERMGAVRGGRITDTGRAMQRIAMPPRLARIILEGRASRSILRACALLEEPRFVSRGTGATTTSDLLSALDAWTAMPPHVQSTARALEHLVPPSMSSAQADGPRVDDAAFRRAVLAGYPDRVARRRAPGSNRFLLATGTGAALVEESGVRDAEFIVALDVTAPVRAIDADSRIRMASAVDRAWLEPTSIDLEHRLDDRGVVKAFEIERYEALTLAERPSAPDAASAADLLTSAYFNRPIPDADLQLFRRMRFAGVAVAPRDLVRLAALHVRALDDVDPAAVLPRDARVSIDRDAPASMQLPSGRHARLEYGDDGSISAAVKLQELFGLAETPRIGPRREPVLLALLSPGGRPVQMTRDLRSFWDRTYPEVRKELRGRYPRHPWPDDPWNATPTARTKPRA
jgi:ATP-dependent helicase HrpB